MTPLTDAVDGVIRDRRTVKAGTTEDLPTQGATARAEIDGLLAVAGFAPFHHVAPRADGAVEPWRCRVLDAEACRRLRTLAEGDGVTGRLPKMLGAASTLALVTWLPQGPFERGPRVRFEGTLINMEHVAAVGAMIQNALLAATARGLPNYWSSGGWLATDAGLDAVGARADELLLGAVFLFPRALPDSAEASPGKHHARRSPLSAWSEWVEAADLG